MRCFYHGDVEAVAICKSCGHAICHDCCAEVGMGAACRNRCESDVTVLNEMVARTRAFHKMNAVACHWCGFLFMGLGLLIFVGGLLTFRMGKPDIPAVVAGVFFFIIGIFFRVFGRRYAVT